MVKTTRLSVNINKIATLRNARGGQNPDVIQWAKWIEGFGADGITVHPRPDERHITSNDVANLAQVVKTEFNIEGYPDARYISMLKEFRPTQATLVPDGPGQLTSDHGWDTHSNAEFLKDIIQEIKSLGIRVSLFIDPKENLIEGAAKIGADRIELYTGPYAHEFTKSPESAVAPYLEAAKTAKDLGLGVNAGHDLDLHNLNFLKKSIPWLDEVSIGHALIADALMFGMENAVQMYKSKLLYY